MKKISFETDVVFTNDKIQTKVILETPFSKEIRILLAKEQFMKEHKAPFPIIIHILEGSIDLGIAEKVQQMKAGDIIALSANIPHNLRANENAIIRLTLSKLDKVERVEKVI